MRKVILILLSIVVSGVFLWLALRDVPLELVGAAIQRANIFWIIVSFLSVGLALFLRGVRWKALLNDRMSLIHCFHIFNVAMLLNQLPLRAGELVRVLLATRYGVPIFTGAASVVVERLLDVVMVVVVLALGLSRAPFVPEGVARTAGVFGVVAVIGFAVLIVFARFPQYPHRVAVWLETRLTFLARFNLGKRVDEILAGLQALTQWRIAARAIFWTLIGWGVSLGTYYTLLLAFNVNEIPDVDMFAMSCLGVSLASLGVAIPLTVAGIGPFQGASRVAGEMIGLDAVISAALGIVFHGVTTLAYSVFGVISVIALGVSFGDLLKPQAVEDGETAGTISPATDV
jgi:uncharacterized protein (TIRG00374 family)